MTKEELVGRKISAKDNKEYIIKDDSTLRGCVTVKSVLENKGGSWSIQYINENIQSNIWKLLPQEPMEYTTPKGIKYKVGTKYTDAAETPVHSIPYEITSVDNSYINVKWVSPIRGDDTGVINKVKFEEGLDSGRFRLVQCYQSVDPTTIKFDFTNTKIKVNSPEESEWIQKVAFANGYRWVNGSRTVDYPDNPALGFYKHNKLFYRITPSQFPKEFDEKESKEITIQDILNNQMKEVIEVRDTVCYTDRNDGGFGSTDFRKVVKVVGDKIYFEKTGGFDRIDILKLVSKGMKQEIIGYELLKDLPGIPAGTKSEDFTGSMQKQYYNFHSPDKKFNSLISPEQAKNTTWFKPIYKAKEVVVKISEKREVKVDKDFIEVVGVKIPHTEAQIAYNLMFTPSAHISTAFTKDHFKVQVITIKVGCQEFTKEDIELVYKAIQNIK